MCDKNNLTNLINFFRIEIYFNMDCDSGCNDLNQKISEWLKWDKVYQIIVNK